jgi:hypothetical protein
MTLQERTFVRRPVEGLALPLLGALSQGDARATTVVYAESGRPRDAVSRVIPLAAAHNRTEMTALCPPAQGRPAAS